MIRLSTRAGQALAELVVELADADRLTRGRSYQRKGYAGPVDVMPGAARVTVAGSRSEPYDVTVAVREAGDNVRTAAAADVAAAVPGAGDIGFSCDCPDWGDPCKHGVAALLQLAREVDDDPALLLRWRGIDDVVPPAPPGTGPLIGADEDGDDPVSFDSLAALDALAERYKGAVATSAYDPDDEVEIDSFGRRRSSGRARRRGGGSDDDGGSDGFGDGFDGDGFGGDGFGGDGLEGGGFGGDRFGRDGSGGRSRSGGFEAGPASEVPGVGDAVRGIRRRFGDDLRPVGATAEARLADLRRRLGADLVDPADIAAAEMRSRVGSGAGAGAGAGVDGGEADGPLDRFFGHHLAGAIDVPAPLDVAPLDAYDHVRIMVETTDAAPVIADALETITDYWITR